MGKVAVHDLVTTTRDRVIIVGRDDIKAREYARSFKQKRIQWMRADAEHHEELVAAFQQADVVVNCAQYYTNLKAMEACLDAGCHYLDLGGLFHMTRKQLRLHQRFRRKRLTAVLGCGSTPGITNVMARYGSEMLDRVEEIHISFAGHDFSTSPRMPFVLPYSAYTLLDEFTAHPAVLAKGKLKFVRPLSGKQTFIFPDPIGSVTGFYTLHSELATFPQSFKKKGLKECSFRVTFPEAFMDKMTFLLELGLGSTHRVAGDATMRDVVAKELNRFLPREDVPVHDIEYIRVVLKGREKKRGVELVLDCLAHSDSRHHFAAGSVDTGTPPSIIAQMIARHEIRERGVLAPETCVLPVRFFEELKKRGMHLSMEKILAL